MFLKRLLLLACLLVVTESVFGDANQTTAAEKNDLNIKVGSLEKRTDTLEQSEKGLQEYLASLNKELEELKKSRRVTEDTKANQTSDQEKEPPIPQNVKVERKNVTITKTSINEAGLKNRTVVKVQSTSEPRNVKEVRAKKERVDHDKATTEVQFKSLPADKLTMGNVSGEEVEVHTMPEQLNKTAEIAVKTIDLQNKTKGLPKKLPDLGKKAAKIQTKPIDSQNEALVLQNKTSDIQNQTVDLQNKTVEIQNKTEDVKNATKEVKDKAADLGNKALEVQNITAELQNKTVDLENQTQDLQNKTLNLQNKTVDLQDKTVDLQNKTVDLETKTTDLQNVSVALQNKTVDVHDETTDLHNIIGGPQNLQGPATVQETAALSQQKEELPQQPITINQQATSPPLQNATVGLQPTPSVEPYSLPSPIQPTTVDQQIPALPQHNATMGLQSTSLPQPVATVELQSVPLPQQTITAGLESTILPQPLALAGLQNTNLPQQTGALPQESVTLSQQMGALPQQNITLPKQTGILPQQNATLPQQLAKVNQQNMSVGMQNKTAQNVQSLVTDLGKVMNKTEDPWEKFGHPIKLKNGGRDLKYRWSEFPELTKSIPWTEFLRYGMSYNTWNPASQGWHLSWYPCRDWSFNNTCTFYNPTDDKFAVVQLTDVMNMVLSNWTLTHYPLLKTSLDVCCGGEAFYLTRGRYAVWEMKHLGVTPVDPETRLERKMWDSKGKLEPYYQRTTRYRIPLNQKFRTFFFSGEFPNELKIKPEYYGYAKALIQWSKQRDSDARMAPWRTI